MARKLTLVSLLLALATALAQDAPPPGTGFMAIPGQKGGQDAFGAYDVVENWPKDTANAPGHEAWTFAAVRGVFAESADRVLAVQLGELPNIERPAERLLPEIGPGIGFPVARAPWRSYRSALGAGEANLLSGSGAREGIDYRPGHGVIVFDRDGNLIEEWTQWDSIFDRPHSIYISPYDPEKHVWVIDDGKHAIFKFTNDGKRLVQTIGVAGEGGIDKTHLFWPSYMDWAPDGSFYVADGGDFYRADRPLGARVVKFDKDGNYLLEWGQEGIPPHESRPAYFNNVHGIAVDRASRRVFVNDRENHRIQVFTADGGYLYEWSAGGPPSDLHMFVISADGYLWAADRGTNKILKYAVDGTLLYSWGVMGDFPGGMWGVHAINVDSEGNFYVAEVDNGRVQKYRPRPGARAAFLVAPAAAALTQSVDGESLKIYAAAAVKTSLTAIAADYEQKTGNAVAVVFDSAGATQQNFLADPDAGLLITSPARIEEAERAGALVNGTSIVLGATVAGIAVPPGSAKPDISSPEKLKAALLAAKRIAFSDPSRGATVGTHFMTVIEALGVKDQVLAKATLAPNGIETMRLVLEEGVDIGITQTVEILQANRDALAGPFPKEFELATTYSLWHRGNISPAVRDFVAMLLSPAGREKLAEEGLTPPAAR